MDKTKKDHIPSRHLSQDLYDQYHIPITILMGHFMLRHLNRLYKEFEGDLVMPIVLGEIAHHNIFKFYSLRGQCIELQKQLLSGSNPYENLEPCNAFSISEAIGIPRETVRRKIDKLVKKGWLLRNSKGEVTISNTVGDHFVPDFNKILLGELLDVSACIRAFLDPAGDSDK